MFAREWAGAYTTNMKLFVSATPAPEARTKNSRSISFLYAGILLVLALAQLFTFDTFTQHFETLDFPGGRSIAHLLAAVIIVCEVFALPFLLRMALSPAFRVFSIACGWLVSVLWLFVSLWTLLQAPEASTIGFLGTLIEVTPGWWAVLLSIVFGIMAVWATWGMGPTRVKK